MYTPEVVGRALGAVATLPANGHGVSAWWGPLQNLHVHCRLLHVHLTPSSCTHALHTAHAAERDSAMACADRAHRRRRGHRRWW